MNPVKTLSWRFGCLIGAMWMGLMLLGNLGGASVFGHVRELHPGIYALNRSSGQERSEESCSPELSRRTASAASAQR